MATMQIKTMRRKNKHGGKRKGAGNKKKFGEQSEIISIRVPKSKKGKLKKEFEDLVKKS